MDYECMNCGYCVGSESLLTDHYRDHPKCAPPVPTQEQAVARAKREILEDIASGRVPASVVSFSELHDHIDANEYGGACEGSWFNGTDAQRDAGFTFWDRVQNAVDAWLKAGRPA